MFVMACRFSPLRGSKSMSNYIGAALSSEAVRNFESLSPCLKSEGRVE